MKVDFDDIPEQARAIPTGNVADALISLRVSGGGVIHGVRPLSASQPRFAGWAYTVQQVAKKVDPGVPGSTRHAEVIDELAAPGEVVVIDVNGRADVCTLGALLALRGRERGLAGFVVNGSVRDVAEIQQSGFPVHAVGSSPQKSSVELETASVGEPIEINGCLIRSGDLVVADDTGAVCVPRADAARVLETARGIHAMETAAWDSILHGHSVRDSTSSA